MSEDNSSTTTPAKAQPVFILLAVALLVIPLSVLVGSVGYALTHVHPHEARHTQKKAVDLAAADAVPTGPYAACVMCHGPAGEGMKAMMAPRLAGQSDWYLKVQLLKFKSGSRGAHADDAAGKLMAPMAKTLVDEAAVDAVVADILGLGETTVAVDTIEGDAANGKIKYAGCIMCHGANGEGVPAMKAPRLQGQHAWYVEKQIKNFRKGIRGGDPTDQQAFLMATMVKSLLQTDKDVTDVAAYIQSLKK